MRTRQEVTMIVAELCSRIALLFPQDKIEAILFGSYARGAAVSGRCLPSSNLRPELAGWRLGR